MAMDFRVVIKGAAFYEDTYRRGEDGRWRISHIGYTRIYETMLLAGRHPVAQVPRQ